MIADKFIASLGVLTVELDGEVRALLLERIKTFFRCGGAINWDDYLGMDEGTQAIFNEANMAVKAEQLLLILKAAEQPVTP